MRGWSSSVALVERLAEIVQERRRAAPRGVAPLSAAICATANRCSSSGSGCRSEPSERPIAGRELRDHAREDPVSRASSSARAGLRPEQQLRELALGVRLDPAADPLGRDVGEARSVLVHLAQRLGCEVELELRDEAAARGRCGAGRPRSSSAPTVRSRAARGRRRRRTGRRAAVREPAGHRVDREVTAGHVLLEPDRARR